MTDPKAGPPTDSEERAALHEARSVIDRDRTGLAAGLNEVKKIAAGYAWLADGEWGSYDYTQRTEATLRKEVRWCLLAVRKAADDALNASRKLAGEACRAIDAVLRTAPGEARGTASASESLDKTQNSEQGALRASLDDQRVSHEAALRAAQQAIQWALDDDDMDAPLRGSTVGKLAQAAHTIERALAGEASGTAPTAPLPSAESSPPAPDLLRENARLQKALDYRNAQIEALVDPGLSAENLRLQEELTRARAAHLENATLLAKANAEEERLKMGYDARGTTIASLEEDVTAMLAWQQDAVLLLHEIEAWIPHQGDIADRHRKRLLRLIGKLPPDGTTSADRKGNAPQAPSDVATAAAPAKEGK